MERDLSRSWYDLSRFGVIFDEDTVPYMIMAADELNLTLPSAQFDVKAGVESYFDFNGSRLPEGQRRIIVSGQWVETGNDIEEFWARVDEIKSELEKTEHSQ